MKSIAYISEASNHVDKGFVPSVLGKIYLNSRRTNADMGVTGVLMYKGGYYFQVIEGHPEVVDRLYETIKANKSHHNVQTLFKGSSNTRYFENFSMKLVNSLVSFKPFVRFHADFNKQFNQLSPEKLALMKLFYNQSVQETQAEMPIVDSYPDAKQVTPPQAQPRADDSPRYAGLQVRLSAWPDFNLIAPTPLVLEACAKLIGEWVSYERYADQLDDDQREQWRELIKYLAGSGLLSSRKVASEPQVAAPEERGGGFYSKLKSFLTGKSAR